MTPPMQDKNADRLIIWCIVFFAIAAVLPLKDHFDFTLNGRHTVITRKGDPLIYWGTEALLVAIGIALSLYRLYIKRTGNNNSDVRQPLVTMLGALNAIPQLWPFFYLAGAILCVIMGYDSLAAQRTAGTNADWILVTITLGICCLFPLSAMAYSRRRGVETFRKPSLHRQPFGWGWNDTLQSLRVSLVSMALYWVGSSAALPKADHKGVMIFWVYAAIVVGLFVGERLVYLIYAKRIE